MEIRETILNDLNKCYPGHILEQEVLAVGRIPCNTNAGDRYTVTFKSYNSNNIL